MPIGVACWQLCTVQWSWSARAAATSPGGEDVRVGAQVRVDLQAAQVVVLAGDVGRERARFQARRPHDGVRRDPGAVGQHRAAVQDFGHGGAQAPLDAEPVQRHLDRRTRAEAEVGGHLGGLLDEDDAASPGEFRGDLQAGETGADHDGRVAVPAPQVAAEPLGALQRVHVEQPLGARNVRPDEVAARGEDEPAVLDRAAVGDHHAAVHVDVLDHRADMLDAHRFQDPLQRDRRACGLRFVEAGAQDEVLSGRDQRDAQVFRAPHPGRRGGAPHPGETTAHDHNMRHVRLPHLGSRQEDKTRPAHVTERPRARRPTSAFVHVRCRPTLGWGPGGRAKVAPRKVDRWLSCAAWLEALGRRKRHRRGRGRVVLGALLGEVVVGGQ
ncbi:hypothetical protein LUX32_37050 [Actinomadura madurae]|nr:hypothetical protein [Actinomadura madurae]MCP9982612.1 hypothetical protein [Actinomadura madurae]MCQ0005842.1 hypothetical protein [Actinomadura madurae]